MVWKKWNSDVPIDLGLLIIDLVGVIELHFWNSGLDGLSLQFGVGVYFKLVFVVLIDNEFFDIGIVILEFFGYFLRPILKCTNLCT